MAPAAPSPVLPALRGAILPASERQPRPSRASPPSGLSLLWPAVAAAVAIALDGFLPLARGVLPALGWIDLAAVACLLWAVRAPGGQSRNDWRTPVDSYVVSGFVLAALQVLSANGSAAALVGFRQMAAAGGCFYALAARLRREPRAPDLVWPALGAILLLLSACAIGFALAAPQRFPAALHELDLRWGSVHGLTRCLCVLSVLCAGRAIERGAGLLWRAIATVGIAGFGLSVAIGRSGLALDVASLARLDEPFRFATSIVVFLLIARLTLLAWQLAGIRAREAGRWRATGVVFPLLALFMLFGGVGGGEEIRLVAALAGAAVVAGRLAPAALRLQVAPAAPAEEPLARAA